MLCWQSWVAWARLVIKTCLPSFASNTVVSCNYRLIMPSWSRQEASHFKPTLQHQRMCPYVVVPRKPIFHYVLKFYGRQLQSMCQHLYLLLLTNGFTRYHVFSRIWYYTRPQWSDLATFCFWVTAKCVHYQYHILVLSADSRMDYLNARPQCATLTKSQLVDL